MGAEYQVAAAGWPLKEALKRTADRTVLARINLATLDDRPAAVYSEANLGTDTLMLFFLSMLGMMDSMENRSSPPYDLYLNSFKKVRGGGSASIDEPPLGDRLRETRISARLTQLGLSRKLELGELEIINYETNLWEPTGKALSAIKRFLEDHELPEL